MKFKLPTLRSIRKELAKQAATPAVTPFCQHDPDPLSPPLSNDYIGWHAEAEKRMAAGEKQLWCKHCQCWIWEHLWRGHV